MYQSQKNNHNPSDIAVALVLKKGDKVTVKNIIGQIAKASKKISLPVGKITMSGLHAAVASASKHQRIKIVTALAGLSTPVEFSDAFPFTKEDLQAYVKVKQYLEQPESEGREDIRPFIFPQDSLAAGQTSRGAVKNTQSAEFDEVLIKARQRIAELKSQKMAEEAIAATLNSEGEGYTTRNGGKFTQGQVNRINKIHTGIWLRFLKNANETFHNYNEKGITTKGRSIEDSLRPVEEIVEAKDTPQLQPSKLRFDKAQMKSTPFDRQPSPHIPDYFKYLDVVITGPTEQLTKGVYLKFIDQDEKLADSIVVPANAIKEGKFRIDILKDTMLLMGCYRMELYDENGMLVNKSADSFDFTLGWQKNLAEQAEMHYSSLTGKVFASPRQDNSGIPW